MNVVTVLTEQEKDNFKTLEHSLSMEGSEHLAQETLDRLLHLAGIAGDRWGVPRSSAVSIISCAGRLGVLGFDHDSRAFDSDKFEMEKKRILHSDNSNDWWSSRNAFYDAITRDPENIFNISDCGYGITREVIKKLREDFELNKEEEPLSAFRPGFHYSYRDSRNGVFFIN